MSSSESLSASSSGVVHHVVDEIAAIVGALVGGAKYGVKIRTPHALVMTVLFRNDLDAKQKIRSIVKLVTEHATNLASFATIYKTILATLKWSSRYLHDHSADGKNNSSSSSSRRNLGKSWGKIILRLIIDGPFSFTSEERLPRSMVGHPELPYHALVAGSVGGYFVWGKYTSVNKQVVLYLTSRIIVGLSKRLWEHIHEKPHHHPTSIIQHKQTYPILAAAVWGIVMVLFEESPAVLDNSLTKSMNEIYRDHPNIKAEKVSSWIGSRLSSLGSNISAGDGNV